MVISRVKRDLLAAFSFIALAGCTPGFVYTHNIEPLVIDFHKTPTGHEEGRGDTKHFSYYVDVQWDKNGIGEIVRGNDMEEIYYADLETLSIMGVWTQRWVHVYGK